MPPSSPSRSKVSQHLSGRHFEDHHLVVVQSGRQGGIIGAPGQLRHFRIRMKDLVRIFGVRGPEENVRSASGQGLPIRRPSGTPATAVVVEMRLARFPAIPDASARSRSCSHTCPLRLAGHRWTMQLGRGPGRSDHSHGRECPASHPKYTGDPGKPPWRTAGHREKCRCLCRSVIGKLPGELPERLSGIGVHRSDSAAPSVRAEQSRTVFRPGQP